MIVEMIGEPPACVKLKDDKGEWSASVKFDGCVNFNRHYDDTDSDYLHICDIDEMIKTLQDIRQKALEVFGSDWAT